MDKPRKRKREKTQISKVRDEKGDIITDAKTLCGHNLIFIFNINGKI